MATHVTLYFSATPPSTDPNPIPIPGSGDTKVLNFALALETLEAELYRQAYARLTGTTYDGSQPVDQFGTTINAVGGVSTTDADAQYLAEFGKVETQHRMFLESALGGNYVVSAGLKFDFGINSLSRLQVVQLIYAAELTGVSAYLGGAGPGGLAPGGKNLAYAAAILGTEARHTAAVAILLNGPLFNDSPKLETAPLANENSGKDYPLAPDQILYQGGMVGTGLTPGGTINPISGPNGFVVM